MSAIRFEAVDNQGQCIDLDVIVGPVGDGVLAQTMHLSHEEAKDLIVELQRVLGPEK